MEGVLAAILESGEPERLYTGLSLLVSTASAGEEARALIGFGALRALLDPELARWTSCARSRPSFRTAGCGPAPRRSRRPGRASCPLRA
jgi:peroxiredoxin family protein